jgi:hypothetical protein
MAGGNNFDPNDAKQIALEIEKIYKRIGLSNPFKSGTYSLSELKAGLEDARDMMMDWAEGIGEIERGFKAILDEVKATSNSFNSAKRNLTSLSSISSQIRDHQLGINQLSSKQLTQLKAKLDSELKSLSINNEGLKQQQKDLEAKKARTKLSTQEQQQLNRINILLSNTNSLLQDQDSLQKQLNDKLEEEIHSRETIEKKLGVTGGILRGISKIPILGNLVDTNEALHVAETTINNTGSSIRGLGSAIGNLGKQAISGLFNPANMTLGVFTLMGKILKDVDSSAGDFAKSMNITYSQALGVREEMVRIASSSHDAAVNSSRLQESLLAINQSLGTNGQISEQDLVTFTKLREQSGLTNEQLVSMQKYSMVMGGSLKSNVEKFQATSKILSYQNKVALNTKQLMVDMGAVSNRVKLSIEGGAAGLAKAAVNAKLMGSDLEKTSAIADQLLNFESSIEAELSAELLTGKDLTLEKARQAALNNDLATVASEITKQMGSAKDFANSNRIQQEAMAKAVGMTADQLGDMLFEQEALRKVGKKLSDEEQRAFETAKQKFGVEEASRMLREGQLDQMVEQQSVQDRFNQSVLKLQEIFVSLAEPILQIVSPFADVISGVAGLASSIAPFVKYLAEGYAIIKGMQLGLGGILQLQGFITAAKASELGLAGSILSSLGLQNAAEMYKLTLMTGGNRLAATRAFLENTILGSIVAQGYGLIKNLGQLVIELGVRWGIASAALTANAAATFGIGAAVAVAAASAAYVTMKSLKDGIVDPKKGPILSGEFGSVQLNPRDKAMYGADGSIKVGTNLVGNSSSPQDNSALIAEIRAMRNELNNRPVVVHSVVKTENNDVLARGTNTANRKSYSIQ